MGVGKTGDRTGKGGGEEGWLLSARGGKFVEEGVRVGMEKRGGEIGSGTLAGLW